MANIPFLNNAYFSSKVGIGVETPTANLHILGTAISDSLVLIGNIDTGGVGASLVIKGTGSASSAVIDLDRSATGRIAGTRYSTSGATNYFSGIYYNGGSAQSNFGIGTDRDISNQKLVITSAGNVGIGTTSPSETLNVSGNIKVDDEGEIFIQGSTSTRKIVRLDNSNDKGLITLNRTDVTNVVISADFANGGHTYFNGLNSNVGIGTTSPGYKLDVSGTTRITSHFYLDTTDAITTPTTLLAINANRVREVSITDLIPTLGGPFLPLTAGSGEALTGTLYVAEASNEGIIQLGTSDLSYQIKGGGTYGYLGINTGGYTRFLSLGTETMRITSTGDVGIGTTSPSTTPPAGFSSHADSTSVQVSSLSVNYDSGLFLRRSDNVTGLDLWSDNSSGVVYIDNRYGSSSSDIRFRTQTGGTPVDAMTIDGNGSVGIGTTNPAYALDVVSSTGNSVARFRNSAGADTLVRIIAGDYNTEIDARLFLGETDTYGMTLEYDGSANIGYIGMNDNVDPTGAYSKRIQMSRGGTEVAFMAGNVGIGTTTPTHKLMVSGDMRLTGAFRDSLNSQGGAGQILSSTGSNATDWVDASTVIGGPYLPLAGGTMTGSLKLNDNVELQLGSDLDLRLEHDGGAGYIQNYTGNLTIRNYADDASIIFQNDDGSGGVETYFQLEGASGGALPFTVFPDNSNLVFGSGHDLRLYHNGFGSYVDNYNGVLQFTNYADDSDIIFRSDNGSGGTTEYFRLDGGAVNGSTVLGATVFPDKSKIFMGTSGDFEIYHDGSNSYIKDLGTGVLNIQGSTVLNIGGTNGEIGFQYTENAGVSLRHNNVTKLTTTSTGVTVTGKVIIADGTTSPQSTDYLYIGGSGLASADAAIYIGNQGAGGGYGYRIYYSGVGSGNDNKLILRSENIGSPVDMLTFTADGNATFAGTINSGAITSTGIVTGDTLKVINGANYWTQSVNSSGKLVFKQGTTQRGIWSGGELQLANDLIVDGNVTVSGGTLTLGADVSLFRDGVSILRTDDAFHANSNIYVGGAGKLYDRSNNGNYIELANTIVISTDLTVSGTVQVGGKVTNVTAGVANTDAVNVQQLNNATTGVLVYQGVWNANTNSPTLASGVGTPGYYYIVDTDGSTNLDGITDWKVGDWAVFSDLATDAWQKIDNTSILGGAGTGGSLAAWSGSGTSLTLQNAPITYSGNNTTFAGSVTLSSGSLSISGDGNNYATITESSAGILTVGAVDDIILDSGSDISLDTAGNDIRFKVNSVEYGKFKNDSGDFAIFSSIQDKDIVFKGNDGGVTVTALILDMSEGGNATFAGDITIGGKTYPKINLTDSTGVARTFSVGTNNETFTVRNETAVSDAFTINNANNATFVGDVSIAQTADVGVLNVANLDSGAAVGLSLTYPTSNVAAGDGLAIAIGIAGRGRSYIANSNVTNNLDASNLVFYTEDGGIIGQRMIINTAGNVGIGTTSPALQSGGTGLHINASVHSELKFTNSTTGSAAGDGTALVASSNGFTINNREAGSLSLGTSNSKRLHIVSGGNVGIGTTTPAAKLDVAGGIRMADDTSTATSTNVGTMRYRDDSNTSYVDMCMRTSSGYEWVNIVQNNYGA